MTQYIILANILFLSLLYISKLRFLNSLLIMQYIVRVYICTYDKIISYKRIILLSYNCIYRMEHLKLSARIPQGYFTRHYDTMYVQFSLKCLMSILTQGAVVAGFRDVNLFRGSLARSPQGFRVSQQSSLDLLFVFRQ